MFGLAGIDIAVIIGYFAVVIAIGVWASRRIKDQTDYFLAGRKFGKFVQTKPGDFVDRYPISFL